MAERNRARILVAHGRAETRAQLEALLRADGDAVDTAESADAAWTVLRASPPVDVVLLDLDLPGSGGLAACRTIRADPALEALGILVVVNGDAAGWDPDAALDAGADGYLAAPVQAEDLRRTLDEMLAPPEGTAARGKGAPSPSVAPDIPPQPHRDPPARSEASLRASDARTFALFALPIGFVAFVGTIGASGGEGWSILRVLALAIAQYAAYMIAALAGASVLERLRKPTLAIGTTVVLMLVLAFGAAALVSPG